MVALLLPETIAITVVVEYKAALVVLKIAIAEVETIELLPVVVPNPGGPTPDDPPMPPDDVSPVANGTLETVVSVVKILDGRAPPVDAAKPVEPPAYEAEVL